MTPLRAQMIRDMQLQRLAPQTQKAYVTAVAGLAKFYQCSPDRLRPEQIRTYLHHLLTERRLAWSSCNQAAAGLKFFSTKTLGWDVLHLDLPPRTGRSQLPQVLSMALQPQSPSCRARDDARCGWRAIVCLFGASIDDLDSLLLRVVLH